MAAGQGRVRRVAGAITLCLALAGTAQAQQALRDLNTQAQTEWGAGNLDGAAQSAEAALKQARQDGPAPDLAAWSTALSNIAVLRAAAGEAAQAEALWREVIAAQDAARSTAEEAVLARMQLAGHLGQQGRADEALALMTAALPMARGSIWHGQTASLLAEALLTAEDYPAFARTFEETVATAPDLIRPVYGDTYARLGQLVTRLEGAGRWSDVLPLLEAQLTILRTFYDQDGRDQAIRNLMYNRYFALIQIGDTPRARTQLLAWSRFGDLSDSDLGFIRSQLDTARALADGANIDTLERLETVRNALFFANALDDAADPQLGLAMRTLASAEGYFGQNAAAIGSLETGIAILDQTAEGRRHVHLLHDDLAWNLALTGEDAAADRAYARSDAAREAALADGPDPETATDRAWRHINRASFYRWSGRTDRVSEEIATAEAALTAADGNDFHRQLIRVRIADMALAATPGADPAPLLSALADLRRLAPPDSPDTSMALANAADTLLVVGQTAAARPLLAEAVAINQAALPDIVPQALAARGMLARLDMIEGRREDAVAQFRQIVEARKSPVYRDTLGEAAGDFEQLAWLLVDRPEASRADLAEAIEALQWTQITRSAEATAILEARLAVDDPTRGALLREKQDLDEAYSRLTDRLSRAQSQGRDTTPLTQDIDRLTADLAALDSRLDALGFDTLGLGSVEPLSLDAVQALLGPEEILITFLLPGLAPDRVAGLEGASNHAIAITRDRVRTARMGEISRRSLNARIRAFRCDVAVSDPGCSGGGAQGLRGAMAAGGPKPRAEDHFDIAAAHALFSDLFGDLAGTLSAYDHIIIAPPPDLLGLPFAALPTSPEIGQGLAGVDWLIRDHAISVLPAIYSLRALRATGTPERTLDRMIGFGDPVIGAAPPARCDGFEVAALRSAAGGGPVLADAGAVPLADVQWLAGLSRLPDSVCELMAIRSAFPGTADLVLGDAATETRVKDMDGTGALEPYDVVIFATHGLTAGETGAADPGLVLTPPDQATIRDDGLLTAGEIATMDLNAQLVVLSACNTAAGDAGAGDGLSGLARAFFQAGARNLMVTHWSVYSEAAVDVSTGMFQALDHAPHLRFSESLRRSVLSILSAPDRPALHYHPSYWAAFAIVGAG